MARKAIGLAAVTVHLTSSSESGAPPSLTLTNTATNLGVQGTTEARRLDWQWADMRDYVWGAFRDRSRALAPDDLRRCLAAVAEAAQQQQQQQRDTERGRGPAAHGGGEEADGGGGRAQEVQWDAAAGARTGAADGPRAALGVRPRRRRKEARQGDGSPREGRQGKSG